MDQSNIRLTRIELKYVAFRRRILHALNLAIRFGVCKMRRLNRAKFYRRLDTDITSDIQTRVEFFDERLHKDSFIDYKTEQFLIQIDPKILHST